MCIRDSSIIALLIVRLARAIQGGRRDHAFIIFLVAIHIAVCQKETTRTPARSPNSVGDPCFPTERACTYEKLKLNSCEIEQIVGTHVCKLRMCDTSIARTQRVRTTSYTIYTFLGCDLCLRRHADKVTSIDLASSFTIKNMGVNCD